MSDPLKCSTCGTAPARTWTDAMGGEHVAPCDPCTIRATVARPDYSHATTRSWCGQDILYLYRRDQQSPSLVTLESSVKDTPENRAVLAEVGGGRAMPGPTRGAGARL